MHADQLRALRSAAEFVLQEAPGLSDEQISDEQVFTRMFLKLDLNKQICGAGLGSCLTLALSRLRIRSWKVAGAFRAAKR